MSELELIRKNVVEKFVSNGFLCDEALLSYLGDEDKLKQLHSLVTSEAFQDKQSLYLFHKHLNKQQSNNTPIDYVQVLQSVMEEDINHRSNVAVKYTYTGDPKKREAMDFVKHYSARYKAIENILKNRQEFSNTMSILRIKSKKDREQVSFIGLVYEKETTKNGNILLTVEDQTGSIKVLISKNKPEMIRQAADIITDEVIGITGVNGDNIVFANTFSYPEIPDGYELKKANEEVYALFLSDLHVGSQDFLEKDFRRFLSWINGKLGNEEQKHISARVKYIIIAGDLVDGVGVYPNQELELTIKDIKAQYQKCAELLSEIPHDIHLILCPGNHDAMRVAEPQLPFYKDFAEALYKLPNATIVSNPALVNIHASQNFSGFDVLMYHGHSFDYYVAEVESIRKKGGYDRADLIMKYLLQKRHLAPNHVSTLYVPDTDHDPLVISSIPDFFISGHIHKSAAANHKHVTLISGSCWQAKTAFQEKVGHNPEPSRVPIVNLQTRNIKMLKFG